MDVTWTVQNVGTSDAPGTWVDRVYLSDDSTAGGDIQIGSFSQAGPLACGDSYTRTESRTVPVESSSCTKTRSHFAQTLSVGGFLLCPVGIHKIFKDGKGGL